MSRHSRVPRESIFVSGQDVQRIEDASFSPSLLDCVRNAEDVCAEVHDSQQLLRNGTFDLPRMSRVLENQRVFLFVNESTVRRYKADLADEIEPQIMELVERAKKGMRMLEKRRNVLQSKVCAPAQQRWELLHTSIQAEHVPVVKATATRSAAGRIEARRLQMLSSQRQSLEKELQALKDEIEDLVRHPPFPRTRRC